MSKPTRRFLTMDDVLQRRVRNWVACQALKTESVRGPAIKGREIRSVAELDRGLVVVWDWPESPRGIVVGDMRPKGIVVSRIEHPFMVPTVAVQVFDGGQSYIFDPNEVFNRGRSLWAAG